MSTYMYNIIYNVKKNETTGLQWSHVYNTKPILPNLDLILNLITVSNSPKSGILNQSIWNYLVSVNEVICLTDTWGLLKEGDLATSNPFFASNFLVSTSSAYKRLSFPTALWGSFLSARWNASWFMNCWIKPIRSLILFSNNNHI